MGGSASLRPQPDIHTCIYVCICWAVRGTTRFGRHKINQRNLNAWRWRTRHTIRHDVCRAKTLSIESEPTCRASPNPSLVRHPPPVHTHIYTHIRMCWGKTTNWLILIILNPVRLDRFIKESTQHIYVYVYICDWFAITPRIRTCGYKKLKILRYAIIHERTPRVRGSITSLNDWLKMADNNTEQRQWWETRMRVRS